MPYAVTIETASARSAGTDSAVSVNLHGRDGDSTCVALDKHNAVVTPNQSKDRAGHALRLFDRGAVDTFCVSARRALGTLTAITLSLEGSEGDCTWLPRHATVTHKASGEVTQIPCDAWLDARGLQGGVSCKFSVVPEGAQVRS